MEQESPACSELAYREDAGWRDEERGVQDVVWGEDVPKS